MHVAKAPDNVASCSWHLIAGIDKASAPR